MRKLFNILTLAAVLMAVSVTAFGQVQPPFTTLSSAIGTERTTKFSVSSATNFVASTNTADFDVFIDHELLRVTAVSGTLITATRAQAGTNATPHKSGATVFYGVAGSQQAPGVAGSPFVQTSMQGSCTPSSYPFNPVIQVNGGNPRLQQVLYFCNGGQWTEASLPGDSPQIPIIAASNIAIGPVAYSSVGNNTTDVANKRMCTTLFLAQTSIITGIQLLQGGTATTDTVTGAIYDSGGNPLANTGATGVALSGANTFLNLPITNSGSGTSATVGLQTKTLLPGPTMYNVCITGNGTAAGAYQTVSASTFTNLATSGTTSITFGTFPAFTPATTFTANVGPVVQLYY